jgi:hypothetical protein
LASSPAPDRSSNFAISSPTLSATINSLDHEAMPGHLSFTGSNRRLRPGRSGDGVVAHCSATEDELCLDPTDGFHIRRWPTPTGTELTAWAAALANCRRTCPQHRMCAPVSKD